MEAIKYRNKDKNEWKFVQIRDYRLKYSSVKVWCGFSDVYVVIKRTIAIGEEDATVAARQADKSNKQSIFKDLYFLLIG